MAVNVFARSSSLLIPKVFTPLTVSARHAKWWEKRVLIELKKRKTLYHANTDKKKLLDISRRSKFVEWNREAEIYAFGKRLQEDFRIDLLNQAFIHRSYIAEERKKMAELHVESGRMDMKDNQYLSEVGEKAISDHVWNYFAHFFPRLPLEAVQCVHDNLTSVKTLAHISKNIGTEHIILSADYPAEDETHAKTVRAIFGALVESQGVERTNLLVRDLIVTQFSGKDINDYLTIEDYFSTLRNVLERDGVEEPEPRIICQTGASTILANYHIGLYSKKKLLGHGSGENIDQAIQMAALDALKRLFHTTDSAKPLRYDAVLSYSGKICNNVPLSEWNESRFNSSKVQQ